MNVKNIFRPATLAETFQWPPLWHVRKGRMATLAASHDFLFHILLWKECQRLEVLVEMLTEKCSSISDSFSCPCKTCLCSDQLSQDESECLGSKLQDL
mmetsp:Transcript_78363/g.122265  ORF Transcript_78363/g.122265 Transcript_78363/m.122265 type:complete len:98 (+) Transcript_78363:130-423(+)